MMRTSSLVACSLVLFMACGRSRRELPPAGSGGKPPMASGGSPGGATAGSGDQFPEGGTVAFAGQSGAETSDGGAAGSERGGRGSGGANGGTGEIAAGGGGEGGEPGPGKGMPAPLVCNPVDTPNLDGPPGTLTSDTANSGVADDFDHDGRVDLATEGESGNVTIYLGHGDGTLADGVVYETGVNPTGVARGYLPELLVEGDLNADGEMDLVASSSASATVSVLLSAGDGSFAVAASYAAAGDVTGAAIGDVDGDGVNDLAVATVDSNQTGAVTVLYGSRDGTLTSPEVKWTGAVANAVALADLNGDAQVDLAVLVADTLTVRLGLGAGEFGDGTDYTLMESTGATIEVDDLNADGHPDLAIPMLCVNGAGANVTVLLGSGDGRFANPTRASVMVCGPIAFGDVNHDAALDAVVTPELATALGNGDGTFRRPAGGPYSDQGIVLGLADFDGDGTLDVAASWPGWILLKHGNGDGSFGVLQDNAFEGGAAAVALADFDGDGALDVAAANTNDRTIDVLFGAGDGSFTQPASFEFEAVPSRISIADIDDNGWPDILDTRDALLGDGTRSFGGHQSLEASTVGDLNGDGRADFVAINDISSLIVTVSTDTSFRTSLMRLDGRYSDVVLTDLDADGRLDVALSGSAVSIISVLFGAGDGTFGPIRQYAADDYPTRIIAGDLNGDGKPELVTRNGVSFSVFHNSGDGRFERRDDYPVEISSLALADFNLDGNLDLVTVGSALRVFLGDGDGRFGCAEEYATGSRFAGCAVGDLNGDGRPDIVTAAHEGVDVFLNWPR